MRPASQPRSARAPKRYAAITCHGAASRAGTGSLATSTAPRGARYSSAFPARAFLENGPTPRPGSMAICSILSATAPMRRRYARRSMRPVPSSLYRLRRPRAMRVPTTPRKRPAAFGGRCRAIGGTHAEAYLHARGLTHCSFPTLRFHPELFYRDGASMRRLPALVAAITGNDGVLTGVQRTWLDPRTPAKAKVWNAADGKAADHPRPTATKRLAEFTASP